MSGPSRTLRIVLALGIASGAVVLASRASAQSYPGIPPGALDEVRRASVSWELRTGPPRRVVDQVALVPDVPTFLEVIGTWDSGHWFPVLIDDVELSFKFLRAFRPARVVRFPRKAPPVEADRAWEAAVSAVGRSWSPGAQAGAAPPRGDAVLQGKDPVPPGMVLSSPDSPMLAGAVALAAGRFQPLVRWDVSKKYSDELSQEDALALVIALEEKVANLTPKYARLGDDCDFLTLAGDWPYRYNVQRDFTDPHLPIRHFSEQHGGPFAFDDLIGRSADRRSRWAFTGRLLGDAKTSVYRAMCSLFLEPKSAMLVNTYDENDRGFSAYSMPKAATRLESLFPTTHRSGVRANLSGWHQAFDPINRNGLVLINSHGMPAQFHVTGGTATTSDVPFSVPAAVVMIHSFSAANPVDDSTIAARWLANGAFVYFGSMNEPALNAFRTPDAVAGLMNEDLPMGAALRQTLAEGFGEPWRLLYLGDPLYRVRSRGRDDRLAPEGWATVASWPRYAEMPPLQGTETDDVKLNWAVRTAVARLGRSTPTAPRGDLATVLRSIRRDALSPTLLPYFDALLADTLLDANRPTELHERLASIPASARSPDVRRILETCQVLSLHRYAGTRDFAKAAEVWAEVVRSRPSREYLELVTGRVGPLADDRARRERWRVHLRAAENALKGTPGAEVVAAERKRVEEQLR